MQQNQKKKDRLELYNLKDKTQELLILQNKFQLGIAQVAQVAEVAQGKKKTRRLANAELQNPMEARPGMMEQTK
jgi:hypothetical protein